MGHLWCAMLAAGSLVRRTIAVPDPSKFDAKGPISELLSVRQSGTDGENANLSHITKLAAVGDSYSAGVGAGNLLGSIVDASDPTSDQACSRHDNAFPYLINEDPRLGDPKKRNFQFRSCSGAATEDVINTQIPSLDSDQEVILVSTGLNDAEFINVLNQCVFQWAVPGQTKVMTANTAALDDGLSWAKSFDWESLSRGCTEQLDYSSDLVQGNQFGERLDKALDDAKGKLSKDGIIYLTSYAKFFSEEMTNECDDVTWSIWNQNAPQAFRSVEYLTVDRRKRLNDLIDAINKKLTQAAQRAGGKVKFVSFDDLASSCAGRYCEPGVNETISATGTRTGSLFYEPSTWDPLGGTPWEISDAYPFSGSFHGQQEVLVGITRLLDQKVQLAQDPLIEVSSGLMEGEAEIKIADTQLLSILPIGYGRVFHPRILLHQLIADRIIFEMNNHYHQIHGLNPISGPPKVDSCSVESSGSETLRYKGTQPGETVKLGTKLRIVGVGDSITVGFLSEKNGGDGNGYRKKLLEDLSGNEVEFVGSEVKEGTLGDQNRFGAWSGKTIKYISDNINPSLQQNPNIILLHAGTNDMNSDPSISTEGSDPYAASERLGNLIDQIIRECPSAVVLVAMIIDACTDNYGPRAQTFQDLIPGVVRPRRDAGHKILAADFTTFRLSNLQDCVHPSNDGYRLFGDYWYDFITQIPTSWIEAAEGSDSDDCLLCPP